MKLMANHLFYVHRRMLNLQIRLDLNFSFSINLSRELEITNIELRRARLVKLLTQNLKISGSKSTGDELELKHNLC